MDNRIGQYTAEGVVWPEKTVLGRDVDRSGVALNTRGLPGNEGKFVVVDFQASKEAVDAAIAELIPTPAKKAKATNETSE